MKNKKALYWIVISLFILSVYNCGSGDGGGKDTIYVCTEEMEYWVSNSGTIAADLAGSYVLSDFDWDYYTVFGNYIRTISKNDLDTASGSMDIGNLTFDQNFSMAGSINLTGNWYLIASDYSTVLSKGSVSWASSTTGTMILDGDLEVMFTASGDMLTLAAPGWCFFLEETLEEE